MGVIQLPDAARRENALALIDYFPGLTADGAEQRLDRKVAVVTPNADPEAKSLASDIGQLLSRTFTKVSVDDISDAELVVCIGSTSDIAINASTIYVGSQLESIWISRLMRSAHPLPSMHGIARLLTACFTCAVVTHVLIPELPFSPPDPFMLDFGNLRIRLEDLSADIVLECTTLVGVGAVGCGFLSALARLSVFGRLELVDADFVSDGNLQRQVCFGSENIGDAKVDVAARWLRDRRPGIHVVPRLMRFEQAAKERPLSRVVVGLDSPRSRRTLQEELPIEVFDASTTGISEVVTFFGKLGYGACLGCVYPRHEREIAWEQHVADHLGVDIRDLELGCVSDAAASKIATRHGLAAGAILGKSYDTLFKQLCGSVPNGAPGQNRALAPFAFVSVLAGTMQAIRLYRHLTSTDGPEPNYWNVSPWYPPQPALRRTWPRLNSCTVCGRPSYDLATKVRLGSRL